MNKMFEGFLDVWKVFVIDSFRREGKDPFIDWFDVGVLLGIASMLGLVFGVIVGLTKLF